jgi:hypothetical protein
MDEMEEKLGAVLNNPQMMQQIMSMAQALGGGQGAEESPKGEQKADTFPGIDLAMVQTLSGLARQSGIDHREQALLHALQAYLTADRVARLERAMRAAKMARFATGFLGQQGLLRLGR